MARHPRGRLPVEPLAQEAGHVAVGHLGVERAWVARYRDKVAGTDDFIALAAKASHRDVTGFLRKWLYGETTPRMPGHPDWTVTPVVEQPTTARASRALARARP